MLKAIYILNSRDYERIYGPEERADIARLVDVYAPPQTAESVRTAPAILSEADVVLSGWGCPTFGAELLAAAPRLKAVFYGAGSIKQIVTEAFWQRGIIITSAYTANAVPVAEFTVAHIVLALKRYWQQVALYRSSRQKVNLPVPGAYGSVVGLVSLGAIGRLVAKRLQSYDLKVIAYDPFVSAERGAELGVEICSLDALFLRADVVSLHTPWLPETEGLITGAHLGAMKPGATFINTARGAVVRESEMIAVLQQRPDLFAILDVTRPEPPQPDSPLYTLPNVLLSPHIAGSMDGECRRMGRLMVEELERYVNGRPLLHAVSREQAAVMA